MEGRSISEDALQCERERVCLTFMATARVALASFSFSFFGATTRATLGRCKYRVNGSQHNSSKSPYPLENFMGQCALLVITNSSASYLLQSYVSFQRQIVGMWSLLPKHKLLEEHIVPFLIECHFIIRNMQVPCIWDRKLPSTPLQGIAKYIQELHFSLTARISQWQWPTCRDPLQLWRRCGSWQGQTQDWTCNPFGFWQWWLDWHYPVCGVERV